MLLTSSNNRLVKTCPSGTFFSSAGFFERAADCDLPAFEGFPSVFLGAPAGFGGFLTFCSSMYFRRSSYFFFFSSSSFFLCSISSSSRYFFLLSVSSYFCACACKYLIFSAGPIRSFESLWIFLEETPSDLFISSY